MMKSPPPGSIVEFTYTGTTGLSGVAKLGGGLKAQDLFQGERKIPVEILSTEGGDLVKSWIIESEITKYLTPEECALVALGGYVPTTKRNDDAKP